MSILSKAHNVNINGGSFNAFNNQNLKDGLTILQQNVAIGAVHDAGLEGFQPLTCHPNTRFAMLQGLTFWLNDTNDPRHVMWVRGTAGVGKSSLLQKFARMCATSKQLSASFFFSRTSKSGRRDEKRLITTIAYQLCQNIPEIRPLILSTILHDPLLFGLSLESQIEKLVVHPLSRLSKLNNIPGPRRPMLIVIDGLDECQNTDGAHKTIIDVFVSAISRMQQRYPHKLLISSRPERQIKAAFSARNVERQFQTLSLDHSKWGAYDDIRIFFRESFAEITDTHPLKRSLSSESPWYTAKDIEDILWKSSGQFIYPAVVVKYVGCIKHDPAERLQVILGLKQDLTTRPYAALDALYSHIFSCVEELDLVLHTLCIALNTVSDGLGVNKYLPIGLPDYESRTLYTPSKLLGVPERHVQLAFLDLASIIDVDEDGNIHFLHTSLPDFLLDKTRSGKYYVDSDQIHQDLTQSCLNFITSGQSEEPDEQLYEFCIYNISRFCPG